MEETVTGEVVPDAEVVPEATDPPEQPEQQEQSVPEPGQSQELVVHDEPQQVTLFGTTDPGEIVSKMTAVANHFSRVIKQQKLTTRIGGGEHVQVEGWQTVGSMLGVFPVKDGEVREIPWPDPAPALIEAEKAKGRAFGYVAAYRAQTLMGHVVGGGEAECKRTEAKWRAKEDHQLRSMAQTRAQSKALKAPLSFIVSMAGYSTTPAEEMEGAEARQDQKYGPEYEITNDSVEKLARAMVYLVGTAESAKTLQDILERDAGYLPRISARAILHTARMVRDKRESEHKEEEEASGSSNPSS